MIKYIVIILSIITSPVWATNYYMCVTSDAPSGWTVGNDSNGGTSKSDAVATFARAFAVMSGGDTLIIADGTYLDVLDNPDSGSEENPTIIQAENDFQVIVDAEGNESNTALDLRAGEDWINITGIYFTSGDTTGLVYTVILGDLDTASKSDHITIQKCVFRGGDTCDDTQYGSVAANYGDYITYEECLFFGKGRYKIYFSRATHAIVRRCVVRYDTTTDWGAMPHGSFVAYDMDDCIFENNISLDGELGTNGYASFYIPGHYVGANRNKFLGNIALNDSANGFLLDWGGIFAGGESATVHDNSYINNIAWDMGSVGLSVYDSGTPTDPSWTDNTSFTYNTSNSANRGFSTEAGPTDTTCQYNVFIGSPVALYGPVIATYCGFYDNTSNAASGASVGEGCDESYTPLTYITRGGTWGATIEKRYEDGVLGTVDLWPFPNEAAFKTILYANESSHRDWTAGDKTLTEYIWEYLGNEIPVGIYPTAATHQCSGSFSGG